MMHTYKITGMTCEGCSKTVKEYLLSVDGITDVYIDLAQNTATITMQRHIPVATLQDALKNSKYGIEETEVKSQTVFAETEAEKITIKTFLPVFLIFGYILLATILVQWKSGGFDLMIWMQDFMAGFFLTFSFFKLLDVPAFAMSYMSYDIVAKKWYRYGYIYPFIELGLGILFLLSINPFAVNLFTLFIMSVSIIGVIQSMLTKRKFQCACLGAVFKLPLSKITLFEDGLMILMAAISLFMI